MSPFLAASLWSWLLVGMGAGLWAAALDVVFPQRPAGLTPALRQALAAGTIFVLVWATVSTAVTLTLSWHVVVEAATFSALFTGASLLYGRLGAVLDPKIDRPT